MIERPLWTGGDNASFTGTAAFLANAYSHPLTFESIWIKYYVHNTRTAYKTKLSRLGTREK